MTKLCTVLNLNVLGKSKKKKASLRIIKSRALGTHYQSEFSDTSKKPSHRLQISPTSEGTERARDRNDFCANTLIVDFFASSSWMSITLLCDVFFFAWTWSNHEDWWPHRRAAGQQICWTPQPCSAPLGTGSVSLDIQFDFDRSTLLCDIQTRR